MIYKNFDQIKNYFEGVIKLVFVDYYMKFDPFRLLKIKVLQK